MKFLFEKEYWKANWRIFVVALLWVCFIVFFTYTTLLVALVEEQTNFIDSFYQEQAKFVSLFVNFGIVFMLVFDVVNCKNSTIKSYEYILPFIAMLLCLIIMAHCKILNIGEGANYVYPINSRYLSIFAFVLYLFCIWFLKILTLLPQIECVKKSMS